MRRSLPTEAGIVVSLVLGAVSFAAIGIVLESLARRRDAKRFPPPGRLVEIDGQRLHIHVSGAGSPTVVLEAGIAATSLSWQLVQPEVAKFTRVCSYDRAGLGWSDAAARGSSMSATEYAAALHNLLEVAGLSPPYLLVGHSFGSLIVRAYAKEHSDDLAGLVIVDPVLPSEWIEATESEKRRLRYGVALSRRGAFLARLGVVRLSLLLLVSGARRIPQLIARISSGQGSGAIERLLGEVQKLPPESWAAIQSHWSHSKSFLAMAAHLESLGPSAQEIGSTVPPEQIPLIVLSARHASKEQRREWDRLAAHAHGGRHENVTNAGHWIHLDAPEAVVNAIRDLVEKHRG